MYLNGVDSSCALPEGVKHMFGAVTFVSLGVWSIPAFGEGRAIAWSASGKIRQRTGRAKGREKGGSGCSDARK